MDNYQMNHNSVNNSQNMTGFINKNGGSSLPICQFYVVLGEKEFQPPRDGNVYINATGVRDVRLIEDAIFRTYKDKHSKGIQVSGKIIFLLADESYRDYATLIIEKVGINGDIQVLPKKEVVKEEVLSEEFVEPRDDTSRKEKEAKEKLSLDEDVSSYDSMVEKNTYSDLELSNSKEGKDIEEVKKEEVKDYSYNPQNNVYHGEVSSTASGSGRGFEGSSKDSVTYMGYNPTLINSNVKTLVKKPQSKKSAAFVHLPVIIFVLSFLLLVGSIILLFVLE